MKPFIGHVAKVLALGLACSALAPACAENDQSLFIRSALLPSSNRQNGTCTYTDDPQQPSIFFGLLDVGLRDNYFGVFLAGNQMVQRGDPLMARAESMRTHIYGGVIRVEYPDGTLIREFTATTTGFADPQNNNTPDFGVFGMIIIDAPTAAILREQLPSRDLARSVNARIRVLGKTLGGKELESDDYIFPIQVCNGCYVSFPPGTSDDTRPRPNCLITPASAGSSSEAGPCFPGQDESVDCFNCRGRKACDPAELIPCSPADAQPCPFPGQACVVKDGQPRGVCEG